MNSIHADACAPSTYVCTEITSTSVKLNFLLALHPAFVLLQRNIGRPVLLGDNALTYIFLPGQEWVKCNEPYCSLASKYTVAEPLVGCTLYDRLTFEWVRWCVTTRCLGAKYDRPFETAQKIALAFKTDSDKKKWKHDWR